MKMFCDNAILEQDTVLCWAVGQISKAKNLEEDKLLPRKMV